MCLMGHLWNARTSQTPESAHREPSPAPGVLAGIDIVFCYHTGMATRTTFTLEESLAQQARELGVNISAAARQGVASAVRAALTENDRAAYERHPEQPDPFWTEAEAWGTE